MVYRVSVRTSIAFTTVIFMDRFRSILQSAVPESFLNSSTLPSSLHILRQRNALINVIIALVIEVFCLVVVALAITIPSYRPSVRCRILDYLCVLSNVIMYGSPLTVMKIVIETKSVKYMPHYLSVAYFCSGVVWLIHTFITRAYFSILVMTYGLGSALGGVQLILYAHYYKTAQFPNVKKPEPERQLSDV
ncbi:bidirectional sugar transporter SWEET5 [Rosa sericea]